MRYQGIITQIAESDNYAIVGPDTIVYTPSYVSAGVSIEKAVYFRLDTCPFQIKLGIAIEFELEDDQPKYFKAVQLTLAPPDSPLVLVRSGLELQVIDKIIDNPSVALNWRFSSIMFERIKKGLSEGKGYAILLRARRDGDDYDHYQVREINTWDQPVSVVTFKKPGDWFVEIYLFERPKRPGSEHPSNILRRYMRDNLLDKDKRRKTYNRRITTASDVNYSKMHADDSDIWNGTCISARSLPIAVPKNIFAPPPPEVLKDYIDYFPILRNLIADECDMRGWAIPLLVLLIPYALLELTKRALHIVFSLLLMLIAAKGSLKLLVHSFAPRLNFSLAEGFSTHIDTDSEDFFFVLVRPWNHLNGIFFTPLALVLYSGGLYILWNLLKFLGSVAVAGTRVTSEVITTNQDFLTTMLIAAAGILVVGLLLINGTFRLLKHLSATSGDRWNKAQERRSARAKANMESQVLHAEKVQTILVSEQISDEFTLKTLPLHMYTFDLFFKRVKRAVCRPFA